MCNSISISLPLLDVLNSGCCPLPNTRDSNFYGCLQEYRYQVSYPDRRSFILSILNCSARLVEEVSVWLESESGEIQDYHLQGKKDRSLTLDIFTYHPFSRDRLVNDLLAWCLARGISLVDS